MPGVLISPRESSSGVDTPSDSSHRSSLHVDDNAYPAIDFDGYKEKPLSEQLEPIAVVGMGMWSQCSDWVVPELAS